MILDTQAAHLKPMFTIAHLTDFSPASATAFAHALRLAVAYRDSTLFILHARQPFTGSDWGSFPHVRESLARWGLMSASDPTAAIEAKTGVRVAKVEVDTLDLTRGLDHFLKDHRPDLLVVATEGREGLAKWLRPSKAEDVFHRLRLPTLFLRPEMAGFVDHGGEIVLDPVLVPVAADGSAEKAIAAVMRFVAPLGLTADGLDFIHVDDGGGSLQQLGGFAVRPVTAQSIEDGIIGAAITGSAKLIVMPTYGPKGLSERLWGSTTERVIHRAPCPVLAVPVSQPRGP